MAGKKLYIGRMIEDLEISMQNVSNSMAETVSILEQILNNTGLERHNLAYSGTDLIDLNPVYTDFVTPDLGLHCEVDSVRDFEFNANSGSGTITEVSFFKTNVAFLRKYETLIFSYTAEAPNGNLDQINVNVPDQASPHVVVALYWPDTGVVQDQIGFYSASPWPHESTVTKNRSLAVSTLSDHADNEEVWIRILTGFNTENTSVAVKVVAYGVEAASKGIDIDLNKKGTIENIKAAGHPSLFQSGEVDTTDNVFSIDGEGILTFSFDLSGTAGELSDVKLVADINEKDSIDLLTAAGDLYDENVGLEIPLAELAALAFKLRFNMSTGSTLSGINVRYY